MKLCQVLTDYLNEAKEMHTIIADNLNEAPGEFIQIVCLMYYWSLSR